MGDECRMTEDVHACMVAEETYIGANMRMTCVGSRGSQMWSDTGGGCEAGWRGDAGWGGCRWGAHAE